MYGFKPLHISVYDAVTAYDGIIYEIDKMFEKRDALYAKELLPLAKEYLDTHKIEWFTDDETGEQTTQDIEVYEVDDCLYLISRELDKDNKLIKTPIAWTYTPVKYLPVIDGVEVFYLDPTDVNDALLLHAMLEKDLLCVPWDPDDIPEWIQWHKEEHGNTDQIKIFFFDGRYYVLLDEDSSTEAKSPHDFVEHLTVQV